MKNSFVSARLVEPKLIRVMLMSEDNYDNYAPLLLVDGEEKLTLKAARQSNLDSICIADYPLEKPLELGHSYLLAFPSLGRLPLDVNE